MTLTAEHAPGNRRAFAAGAMFCGFPLGALLGGLAAPSVIEESGWQGLFFWGGVLPLAMVVPLFLLLVESPEWQARDVQKSRRLIPLRSLFGQELAIITPLLWLAFIANLLASAAGAKPCTFSLECGSIQANVLEPVRECACGY